MDWMGLIKSLLQKPSEIPGVPALGASVSAPLGTGYTVPGADLQSLLAGIPRIGLTKLGSPYGFGSKWPPLVANPMGKIDCSGFVRWCYWQGAKFEIPDGSAQQFLASVPSLNPFPGDVGFFRKAGVIDHVGILCGHDVVEARAFDPNASFPTGQVILRPRAVWEAWPEFTGWRRMIVVTQKFGSLP